MGFLAEFLAHGFLHGRHADHTADQHDFINLGGFQVGVRQCTADRFHGFLDQVAGQLFQFGAGQSQHQMFRTAGIRSEVGQVDFGLLGGGELDLGFFSGFFKSLQSLTVVVQINRVALFELVDQIIHHALIKVIAAQEGVTVGRANLKDAFSHIQNGNIEGAAAQVIHGDDLILFLIQTVSQ